MNKYHAPFLYKANLFSVCDNHRWRSIVIKLDNQVIKDVMQCEHCLEQKVIPIAHILGSEN